MDGEKIKYRIGSNIATYRKQAGLTQAELAERINFSDKAVSKWERGESIPDVITLIQLAEQFDITLDELVGDPGLLKKATAPLGDVVRNIRKISVQKLSSILVWFMALLVYVVLSSVNVPKSWVAFVYAVPVNALVLLILRSAFREYKWNCMLISIMVWGILASIYVTLLVFANANVWKIILLGLLGQLAILLWFRMLRVPGKGEADGQI